MLLLSCCFLAVSKSFVNAEQFDILQISNVPFPKSSYGTGEGQDKNVVLTKNQYMIIQSATGSLSSFTMIKSSLCSQLIKTVP